VVDWMIADAAGRRRRRPETTESRRDLPPEYYVG
jgi:hypothetical protein